MKLLGKNMENILSTVLYKERKKVFKIRKLLDLSPFGGRRPRI